MTISRIRALHIILLFPVAIRNHLKATTSLSIMNQTAIEITDPLKDNLIEIKEETRSSLKYFDV